MHTDDKKAPIAIEQEIGAAFVASGVGSMVLGLATVLAEISEPIRSSLFWIRQGGPLSGETCLAVIAFVFSWGILTIAFKKHPIRLRTSFVIALALVSIGLLLTFPPIFRLVAQLSRAKDPLGQAISVRSMASDLWPLTVNREL